MLSFIGVWQQRVKTQVIVRDLLNIIVPFALVNGLKSGMSSGKMELFQDPCEGLSDPRIPL